LRLVVCYNGSGLEDSIASLINEANYDSPLREVAEPIDQETVRLWFSDLGGDYEPESFAAILSDTGELLGYGGAWTTVTEEPAPQGFMRISLRGNLAYIEAVEAAQMLLMWGRHSLEYWSDVKGVVDVNLHGRGGLVHSVLAEVLGGIRGVSSTSGYLMVAPKRRDKRAAPRGYKIREAAPHRNREDAEKLVEIFNESFNVYDTFWPWRVERAIQYYRDLFSKRRAVVLIAEDSSGSPVGFVEAYAFESLSGTYAGELSLLAVKSSHQRRGLGTTLLNTAENTLRGMGVDNIFLYATPRASSLYLKLGYRIIFEYLKIRLPVYLLPGPGLDGVTPWDIGTCPNA